MIFYLELGTFEFMKEKADQNAMLQLTEELDHLRKENALLKACGSVPPTCATGGGDRGYLNLLMDSLEDIIYLVDSQLRIVTVNRACRLWLKRFGVTGEVVGKGLQNGIPFLESLARQGLDEYSRVLETGEALTSEEKVKIGEKHLYLEARKIPLKEEGRITGIITVVRDVTPVKYSLNALQHNQQMLNSLIKNMPDVIYRLNNDGRIVFINNAIEKYGYRREELMGQNILDLVSPLEREKALYRINERRTGRRSTRGFELSLLRKSDLLPPLGVSGKIERFDAGLLSPLDFAVFLVTAEGIYRSGEATAADFVGTQGFARDITEKKWMAKELKESEKRFCDVLEHSRDIHYRMDYRSGTYDYISPAIMDLFGFKPLEILTKGYDELRQFLHPEDRDRCIRFWKSLARIRGNRGENEFRILDKNGRYRWLNDSCVLLRDADDEPRFIIGNARDITEMKQVLEEKKELEQRLGQAEKMETIGRVAGGVAHDLNNVLSSIVSYPDLLLLNLPGDSRMRKPILTIQKAGQRAVAIVQDLLTLVRRSVLVDKVVSLNHLVVDYLKSPEYEKLHSYHPGVHVETLLKPGLLNIKGSPVHLTKALMNLVSNAAEAMPKGGTVTLCTFNRYIDRSIEGYDLSIPEGDYVVMQVADNGVGIASEDLKKIFQPFYTKKEMGRSGTGLGMAVVWTTVKDHHGYLDVRSCRGKGTTFELYFPITREREMGEKHADTLSLYMGNGETILVVDDVEEQREIASLLLTRLGYRVVTAAGGEGAVAYFKRDSADLVILDMIMEPGLDGLDTYKEILRLKPGVKAIISSGYVETDRVKEAMRLGAGQYIRKPYSLEKIAMAVKTELARSCTCRSGG